MKYINTKELNKGNDLDIVMATAKYLKSARIEKSLTGTELGKLLNLSQQQISRYENGQSAISIDSLHIYLRALGKDWLDYFRSVILVRVHANYY
ncbi:helix-turn-helix domain-containing protein [Providencia huaxiensis]|uniref:helix-turn-helix domain-containing protein n=1 Tax=Providencia TaxID=586 RepID=UPI001B3619E6|nr:MULTISPECIES: helix-turn-helix transcriptional regulator [Providencia]MBQ0536703.1 helix-turn-helix transcriptional regulator [Providencia huaxiensis]MBQ0589153.1 helix-turn-helix transcriptional regulator [Providencia huaxiensis]MDI7240837.1 helix-turn-helix transcriptional regulator [Providencia huaxiensis]